MKTHLHMCTHMLCVHILWHKPAWKDSDIIVWQWWHQAYFYFSIVLWDDPYGQGNMRKRERERELLTSLTTSSYFLHLNRILPIMKISVMLLKGLYICIFIYSSIYMSIALYIFDSMYLYLYSSMKIYTCVFFYITTTSPLPTYSTPSLNLHV
jgi:hypothetical protein